MSQASFLCMWITGVTPWIRSRRDTSFAGVRAGLERRDAALGRSFTERYKIWLAVHSLLYFQDEQQRAVAQEAGHVEAQEAADERERQERCRIATLSAMFAEREVRMPAGATIGDD